MKTLSTSNLLFFKSKNPHVMRHYGLKNETVGYYHPWKEFNTFQKNPVKIPKNFIRTKPPKTSFIKKYVANRQSHRLRKPVNFTPYELEHYEIRDNGSTPYIVYVNSSRTTVSVFCIPKNNYVMNSDWSTDRSENYGYFTELVKKYKNVRNVMAGVDKTENMTGNSVLIRLSGNNYVYIGDCIYSFKPDETITEYYSNVGNSCVPYPVGVSKSYVYFMLDKVYVEKTEFPEVDFTNSDQVSDLYSHFYKAGDGIRKTRVPHYRLVKRRLI